MGLRSIPIIQQAKRHVEARVVYGNAIGFLIVHRTFLTNYKGAGHWLTLQIQKSATSGFSFGKVPTIKLRARR
jgi:hypothetical protein